MTEYGEFNPIVYTDSAYCINTFTNWMYGWERHNWKKSDDLVPKNLDLIQLYYNIVTMSNKRIDLRKVKGHAGHVYNEIADKLATGELSIKEAWKKVNKEKIVEA